MAPKKKAAAAKAAGAPVDGAEPAVAALALVAAQPAHYDPINKDHLLEVGEAIEHIKTMFPGISDMQPLKCDAATAKEQRGIMAPYDAALFTSNMKDKCEYLCGMNMLDENWMYSATPGIPINRLAVQHVRDVVFAKPCRFPVMSIALESADQDPMQHRGALMSTTPEEIRHAYYMAIARDCTAKKTDQATLDKWMQYLLSCCFEFKVISSAEDRYWEARNARDKEVQKNKALERTIWQRMAEITAFRVSREAQRGSKLSNEKIAEIYKLRAEAEDEEFLSIDFFKKVEVVWTRGLCIPSVKKMLADLDAKFGIASPLNGISKIYGMVVRAGDCENIEWSFACLADEIDRGRVTVDDCSVRALTGMGVAGKVEKCWVDVYMFKKELLRQLLGSVLEGLGFQQATKTAMRKHFADHAKFTEFVAKLPGSTTEADLRWQQGYKSSMLEFCKFVEDCIYSKSFDGTMKTALKNRRTAEDFMDYQQPSSIMEAITNAVEAEKKADDEKLRKEQTAMNVIIGVVTVVSNVATANATPGPNDGEGREDGTAPTSGNAYWRDIVATRMVQSHVTLLPEPTSELRLADFIKSSKIFDSVTVHPHNSLIAIIFDPKTASESTTQPETRSAPLKEDQVLKLLRGCLRAFSKNPETDAANLEDGYIYMILDGGKPGEART